MSKKKLIGVAVGILLIIAGSIFIFRNNTKLTAVNEEQGPFDPKNATYLIEGKTVTLVNGVSEIEAAPGSASKVTTRYFGNDATGDLNGDGLPDSAFLITQDGGGSGLFYYAVAALKTADGYKTTNAFFIGDRIAPQTTEIHEMELHGIKQAEIYVNYAERNPGEPMTAQPSRGATTFLKVTPEGKLTGLMQ